MIRNPAQALDQLAPDFLVHKTARFTISFVDVCLFRRFSAIPLDFFGKVVYNMNQEIFKTLFESLRSVLTPEMLFDIFLIVAFPAVFVSFVRLLFHFADPFYMHRRRVRHVWKEEAGTEAKVSCTFHCDCEDCVSYESGKYCSRCDRFQMCAYCSAREHCDL